MKTNTGAKDRNGYSMMNRISCWMIVISGLLPLITHAQEQKKKADRRRHLYFSWGYNGDRYTRTDIHIVQPTFHNDYTFSDIKAQDHKGWDEQFFEKPITVPQYNYRLGWWFNEEKNLGFEINFDHTKFIVSQGQEAHLTGTLNGEKIDTVLNFSTPGFSYFLNNGANFFCLNIVKRLKLVENKKGSLRLDLLGKAGAGPVVPHVQDILFGESNHPHFQIGGWDAGVEAGIKFTFFKYVYLEYTNKLDYARYSGLRVYFGTANQAFGTYEMVLNIGINFRLGKRG